MGIGVSGNNYNSTVATSYAAKAATVTDETEQAEAESEQAEGTQSNNAYKVDIDKVRSMKNDYQKNMLAFKQMVYSMYKQQGGTATNAMKQVFEIDKNTQLEAQEAISENGYWGVDQTAQRLLDFAKAVSGGDPSKLSEIRGAIEKGFEAAEKVWGGSLPDICYQTQKKVMDTLDQWEAAGSME